MNTRSFIGPINYRLESNVAASAKPSTEVRSFLPGNINRYVDSMIYRQSSPNGCATNIWIGKSGSLEEYRNYEYASMDDQLFVNENNGGVELRIALPNFLSSKTQMIIFESHYYDEKSTREQGEFNPTLTLYNNSANDTGVVSFLQDCAQFDEIINQLDDYVRSKAELSYSDDETAINYRRSQALAGAVIQAVIL